MWECEENTNRDKERETEWQRQTETFRMRDTDRETDSLTDREKERQRWTDRQKQERERRDVCVKSEWSKPVHFHKLVAHVAVDAAGFGVRRRLSEYHQLHDMPGR